MSTNNEFEQKTTPENECCDSGCDCDCSENTENSQNNAGEMSQEQMDAIKAFNEHLQGLNNQIEEAQNQALQEKTRADELAKKIITLQSDFDNYRRRNADLVKTAREEGSSDVLIEVIKILDIIEQAQTMIKDSATIDGIKMIFRQIESLLRGFGVQEIEAVGLDFDPNIHNAVEKVKQEGTESGKITEVISKGYRLGEKILRYSSVKVAE